MRNVVSSDEIFHLWIHQTQAAARNPGGRIFFEGEVIYSYGKHFPMGRIVTRKDGEKCVLLNTARYSVTTSKHQGYTWRAVPAGMETFHVPNLLWGGWRRVSERRMRQTAKRIRRRFRKQ